MCQIRIILHLNQSKAWKQHQMIEITVLVNTKHVIPEPNSRSMERSPTSKALTMSEQLPIRMMRGLQI